MRRAGSVAGALGAGLLLLSNAPRCAEPPEAIRIGRSLFLPSIEISYSEDDNLFQQELNQVEAQNWAIGPSIEWRIPWSRSRLSLFYDPRFKVYDDKVLPDNTEQHARLEYDLTLRGGSQAGVRMLYESGILETAQLTGGESTFVGNPYERGNIEIGFGLPLGARHRLELGLFGGETQFEGDQPINLANYSDSGFALGWALALSDKLAFRVEGRGSGSSEDRGDLIVVDQITGETSTIPGFFDKQYEEVLARTGIEGEAGGWFQTRTYLGYDMLTYTESTGSDYSGKVLESESSIRLGPTLHLRVLVNRLVQPSAFNLANYFINENVGLGVVWQTPRRLRLSATWTRQENSYRDPVATDLDGNPNTGIDGAGNEIIPDPANNFVAGVLRLDEIGRLEGRVEFDILPRRLSLWAEVFEENRDSNIHAFDFDRQVVTLGLRFGWLPRRAGGI